MPLRLCVYNVEWSDNWFNSDNTLKSDDGIPEKVAAFKQVMSTIDPDLIGIVEGPNTSSATKSTVKCLEALAARTGIRAAKALTGFTSAGRQELAVLHDPAKLQARHDPGGRDGSRENPPFSHQFFSDSDLDGIDEVYRHYRPPLEATITRQDGGDPIHLIVVHLKSKGIFSNNDYIHWERESLRNRRKLFAEAHHVRLRVEERLKAGGHVVVMGDVNDGPGMDMHEAMFGRSAVELLIGSVFYPTDILWAHCGAPNWGDYGWEPSSARFTDPFTKDPVNVLIDHILASQGIKAHGADAHRVWNPYQRDEAEPLKHDLLKVSDHFPVSLDIV